jgi:hypothetical protein
MTLTQDNKWQHLSIDFPKVNAQYVGMYGLSFSEVFIYIKTPILCWDLLQYI